LFLVIEEEALKQWINEQQPGYFTAVTMREDKINDLMKLSSPPSQHFNSYFMWGMLKA
jgi:hypothetical protein